MRHAPGPRHPPVDGQLAPSTVDGTSEADEWDECIRRSEEASARRVVRVAGVRASTPRESSPDYYHLGAAPEGRPEKRVYSGFLGDRPTPVAGSQSITEPGFVFGLVSPVDTSTEAALERP